MLNFFKKQPKKETSTLTKVLYTEEQVKEAIEKAVDKAIKDYEEKLSQSFCDAEVDLIAMRAFSIERSPSQRFNTLIGYLDKDDNVKEWYLRISDESHNRLLERFRALRNIK